jgi:type IV secretion system protein VirB6
LTPCPSLGSGDAFLSSLLRHIDCQGRVVGVSGYEALSAPGSPLLPALTAALVLFVAVHGARMALGAEAAPLRSSVPVMLRIGVVLTLATSWPAVQVVIFDVVTRAPDQISALIGGSRRAAGGADDLIGRLQTADQAILRLIDLGTGRLEFSALPAPGSDPSDPPQRIPIADNPAFGLARVIFLSGAIAVFTLTRLVAGVLLALTPLFAALLLFNATRGVFVGWARALVFTGLSALALGLILDVQLRLLTPWLEQVIALRRAREITASAPTELLILCLSFAVALIGAFALLLRLAFMPQVSKRPLRALADYLTPALERLAQPLAVAASASKDHTAASRALVVADAVAAAQGRETARRLSGGGRAAMAAAGAAPAKPAPPGHGLVIPEFGASGRRSRLRTSLGAQLRGRRS